MEASTKDAETTRHDEQPTHQSPSTDDVHFLGCETDLDRLPKGYYTSRFFLGTMMATGLGVWAAVSSFGYAAPILNQINADVGPDPRYNWISLVYNAALAISVAPFGRLGDIFGRRYFFIAGGIIGVVGSVVCATAKDIPTLIVGTALLGLCSATQFGFHFVIGELIPLRFRYIGNAVVYAFCIPGSGLAPLIAYQFTSKYPSVGWRGIYWMILAMNVSALACWTLFYFPPSFQKKHRNDENASVSYWLKNFDWVGFFLFASGFLVFLLGLSWGGVVYPWKSAAVIAAIVIGFSVMALFVLWEVYAPLKEPLIPLMLFKNRGYVVSVILLGLAAGVYYAFSIIWPIQCSVLYSNGDMTYLGGITSLVGVGTVTGQITGGMVAARLGKMKYQCLASLTIGGAFLGCVAVTNLHNKDTAIALMFLGTWWLGWNENITLANTTLCLKDQKEIGVAGGLAASTRSAICSVLVAVYTTILNNHLEQATARRMPPALTSAGLPAGSVSDFITVVSTAGTVAPSSAYDSVQGVTDKIIDAGVTAYRLANVETFRVVYLTTIAFSGLAVILAFWAPNTEEYMTDNVAATLNQEERRYDEEKNVRDEDE